MNDQKRKSLKEVSDESEQFESQFERLVSGEGDELARVQFIAEITDWLQECAQQGRFIPLASADRRAFGSLLGYWSSRLRQQGLRIEGIDSIADFDPKAGVVLTRACPYPGLDPYSENRRNSFFGRETLVSDSVGHLERQANRILLIIGASGSGKSSLALAGILPRLMELHDGEWIFGPRLTPGAHPLAGLAASVAHAIGHPDRASEIERSLTEKPDEALGQVAELCRHKPLMLLIDQFEELLTLCRDAGEQSAYAQALCALSNPNALVGDFCCRILVTLRTDHLARFESNNALKPLHMRLVGENNERYLSAIGFIDIKRAIKEPAEKAGLRFVPVALIDRLASQTAGLSNGLPLLQFALHRLWDTRPKNESGEPLDLITEEMVNALPDVERALGTVADGVFYSFSSSQQQRICERLLLELVVLDESFEEPLRRRRNEAEVMAVLQNRFQAPGDVDRVIGDFVAARLLRRFGEVPDCQIEVAHEALLRHWDHIYRLVTGAEVKERLHLIKQIGRQAGEWAGRGKTDDYLSLRGERLHRALAYAEDGWLAEAGATAYIDACRKHDADERRNEQMAKEEKERADAAEKARQAAELKTARLRNWFWGLGLGAALALLIAVTWLLHMESEESFSKELAVAAGGEIHRDSQLGLLLALEAARHGAPLGDDLVPEAERALRSAVRGSSVSAHVKGYGHTIIKVSELSPDGTLLATGDSLGGVTLWDAGTGVLLKALFAHVGSVNALAFTPEGTTMASGGDDGKVVVWDIVSGEPLHVLIAHVDEVNGLAFSRPDGRLLASAGKDDSVHLWDVSAGKLVRTLHGHIGGVRALAFGRDEQQLATAGNDDRVAVWDALAGRLLYSFSVDQDLFDVEFSSDGSKLLAAAGSDVEIYDTVTRGKLMTLTGHTNSVVRVRFSRDQRRIATASLDATVRVWRVPEKGLDTRRQAEEMARFSNANTFGYVGLGFSPTGERVAATSLEGIATLWSVICGGELLTLDGHDAEVKAVVFSPDGRNITAAGGSDRQVIKWDLSGKRIESGFPKNLTGFAGAVAYSRNGVLAIGAGKEVLVLQPGVSLPLHLAGHKDRVTDLAFTPDGSRLVSGSYDRTAIVWELPSGNKVLVLRGHTDHVTAVACSPDGKIIVTGSKDKAIKWWRADTGKLLEDMGQTGQKHFLGILDLAFSSDGRLLVSGSKDKSIRIWDVTTGGQIAILSGHGDVVHAVAISGDYLATGSDDTIRLWDLRSKTQVAAFSARDRGAVSLAFSPDGRYLASGARDGVVSIYVMQGKELVELANSRIRRGLTKSECEQFLREKPCPRSNFSILDEAHESFQNFDFKTGEQLLREAKVGAHADSDSVNAEVGARLGSAFLWAASDAIKNPDVWAELEKGKSPQEVALAFMVAALERSPDLAFDPESRVRDLIAYLEVRKARELARNGNLDEAVAAFEKAQAEGWTLSDEPAVVASQLYALHVFFDAWAALRAGQLSTDKAKNLAERVEDAAQRYPNMGPAHRLLARLYDRKGDLSGTEKHYLEAAAIESSPEPLVSLALSMVKDSPKKAIEYAKLALERYGASDETWFTVGFAEHELENWKASALAFDQVSPSSVFFSQALNFSAVLNFERLGDDQAAYQRLTFAVQRAPNDPEIRANYAEILLASGRRDQAKEAAAWARQHADFQKPGKACIRAAMSFVLFGAELLSGDRQRALVELDKIEAETTAAAAEAKAKVSVEGWTYKGIRRSLEQMSKKNSPEQQSAMMKVLDFVESNMQSGSLDDMRQLLSFQSPSG